LALCGSCLQPACRGRHDGIGGASLLEHKASAGVFRAMLNLKIIWATSAVMGIGLGLLRGGPPMGWVLLVIFAAFLALWAHYRLRLHRTMRGSANEE